MRKNSIKKINRTISNLWLFFFLFTVVTFAQKSELSQTKPDIIILPESTDVHSLTNRKFTGIPSLAITNEGKMWAVWYAGITPDEDANNYVVVSASKDKENSWKEKIIIDPDGNGPVRAFDPEVWIDPNGKLWIFWAQTIGHDGTIADVWAITSDNADSDNPEWTKPRKLTNGIMMCKPTVLSSGEWILPVSTWKMTDYSAKAIVSTDNGKTWSERGAVNVPKDVRSYDEHMIVERKDGTLWMLVRTNYGIGESTSKDKGKSWSELIPSKLKHPSARFFIRRLKSGNLLLVKHGPIDIETQRSHLMAFISKDDGRSWSRGLLLDQRRGVSYPDGQQVKDRTIYIVYDYNRRTDQNILITSFSEENILSDDCDKEIIKVFNNRKTISKGSNEF